MTSRIDKSEKRRNKEREIAIELAKSRGDAKTRKLIDQLKPKPKELFGQWTFNDKEAEHLRGVHGIIKSYIDQKKTKRPLSIGVFGSPGSGKSRTVKSMRKALQKELQDAKRSETFPEHELNLTQLPNPDSLSRRLAQIFTDRDDSEIPFVFIDEFDAPLLGAKWGWLSWFLAPMQDGRFECQNIPVKCANAIFIFAGGTASSISEFGKSDEDQFRTAKGPDFTSRLKASLDIKGTEEFPGRDIRRALTIKFEVNQARELTGRKGLRLSDELARRLLDAGRYCHGARSLASTVEMCCTKAVRSAGSTSNVVVSKNHLPPESVCSLHVDRGPLDPRIIGGLIGFSGGASESEEKQKKPLWVEVARAMIRLGASLGYGGRDLWENLTGGLLDAAKDWPARLVETPDPYVELFSWEMEITPQEVDEQFRNKIKRTCCYPTQKASEKDLNDGAFRLTRMRKMLNSRCVARILVMGDDEGRKDRRMPGIFEEAILAMAADQPIYIVADNKATSVLGQILGLARSQTDCEIKDSHKFLKRKNLKKHEDAFRCGDFNLPLTYKEAVTWLENRPLNSPGWPDNGLSAMENQDLFEKSDPAEIIRLISQGLEKRFQ